jgi:hypothetical protein
MTTRKAHALLALLVILGGLLGGCATPGPLHVYSLAATGPDRQVLDTGNGRTAEVSSFLEDDDIVTGFAYDPFTDHFFLRLSPGNRIRVVDRPARAVKREFQIDDASAGGDLTARPRDGHLFLLRAGSTEVLETSRLGKTVRIFSLAGLGAPPLGIAVDPAANRLLILGADGVHVTTHDLDGARLAEVVLEKPLGPSLAFDAEKRELYGPLRDRAGEIGVFDAAGKFLRVSPLQGSFVDVGVRSLVRVF